ncbi:proline-rich protein 5-like isoform X2 [Anolis carolinensis]|uniref:proline-rich protein 5-like isoform X2 n=1 Tax=Anolis carolinensis TaxID=28377 RepID=UPI002F2B3AE0
MTRDSTTAPVLLFHFQKMGSFRRPRPRFMSSPVLSDLPRFLAARQSLQFSSNSAWNSVQTAVINVFKGGGLQNNELYTLNENVRRLLKSELGPFITDYFQNQLLAKGLLFIEEKVKLSEGENRIHVLSEIWDHFFTETLPTLQAIFYPVQGQELTVRQIALLGFRDLVLLKVKMDEFLPRVQNNLPPSIVQMLLILQGVHEPTGPSKAYMQLEELVKLVVSPYLGLCEEHCYPDSTCALAFWLCTIFFSTAVSDGLHHNYVLWKISWLLNWKTSTHNDYGLIFLMLSFGCCASEYDRKIGSIRLMSFPALYCFYTWQQLSEPFFSLLLPETIELETLVRRIMS